LAISLSGAGPITPALPDLNAPGQGAAGAGGGITPSNNDSGGPAPVAIGQDGRLDITTVDALAVGLNAAAGIADFALGAGQTVGGLLSTLKSQAATAEDPALEPESRQGLNADFRATLGRIAQTVAQARFDGVNLLNGSAAGSVKIPGGGSLTPQDLTLGGAILTLGGDANVSSPAAASAALADVSNSMDNLDAAMSALEQQAGQISAHGAIVGQLSGALKQALSGADGGADGARLLALQVQQGLNAEGAPIANTSPQLVLSLFR
jgi:flagellin